VVCRGSSNISSLTPPAGGERTEQAQDPERMRARERVLEAVLLVHNIKADFLVQISIFIAARCMAHIAYVIAHTGSLHYQYVTHTLHFHSAYGQLTLSRMIDMILAHD